MITAHIDRIDPVLAADLDRHALRLQIAHALDHELFEIRLLQVDEGRELVPILG